VGLYGAGYANAQGRNESFAIFMNGQGTVAGTSNRFSTVGQFRGAAAWFGRAGTTTRVGLFDAGHTSLDGSQTSWFVGLNPLGFAAGNSLRYEGSNQSRTAWITDGNTTTLLGLTDTLHTGTTGLRDSTVQTINTNGDTAGYSVQLASGVPGWNGATAWARRGGSAQAIGLVDAEHTRTDGLRSSNATMMSDSGVVAGYSRRYSDLNDLGQSAWVDDGTQSRRIGLQGALYTSQTGSQTHVIQALSVSGVVTGHTRANYVNSIGNHAWIATPDGNVNRIGLIDAQHTGPGGRQYAESIAINSQSKVIGRSFVYSSSNGQSGSGESAWIFENATTRRLGFTDADHTVPGTGAQFSRAISISASGAVLGESTRTSSTGNGGRSIWVDTNGQTRRTGLFDSLHINENGFQDSQGLRINALGDAIGTSSRSSGALASTSGWFYDSVTAATVPLVFSTSANNEANTTPALVLDNRTVLGTYFDYGSQTNRLFWWSSADGVFDITAFVTGGIGAAGWDSLSSVFSTAVPGSFDGTTITGIGKATNITGNAVYVLTPVPAPGVTCLAAIGCTMLGTRRRK